MLAHVRQALLSGPAHCRWREQAAHQAGPHSGRRRPMIAKAVAAHVRGDWPPRSAPVLGPVHPPSSWAGRGPSGAADPASGPTPEPTAADDMSMTTTNDRASSRRRTFSRRHGPSSCSGGARTWRRFMTAERRNCGPCHQLPGRPAGRAARGRSASTRGPACCRFLHVRERSWIADKRYRGCNDPRSLKTAPGAAAQELS